MDLGNNKRSKVKVCSKSSHSNNKSQLSCFFQRDKRNNKQRNYLHVGKKSYMPSRTPKGWLLSPIFLVEKKGGEQRPVINLRALYGYIMYRHFKMEGINWVKNKIQQGDWLIKGDLKDAYFTIPIYNVDQKYLRFLWEGNAYHVHCLPFGITVAPWVFTKLMKVPVSYLRRMRIRLIIYLDDILVMNQTKQGAYEDGKKLRDVLES